MTPWVLISIVIAIVALAVVWLFRRKMVLEGPTPKDSEPITTRRLVEWCAGLTALNLMTVGYTDFTLWFLPVMAYVTFWIPIVRRKSATVQQSWIVGGVFAVSMILAVALQMTVWGD